MKTIYLDCAMGAAGDMLMGALLELLPDKVPFLEKMNALGLPGIEITAEDAVSSAVLKAFEQLHKLRKNDAFKSWLFQITANECKKLLKQKSIYLNDASWQEPAAAEDGYLTPEIQDELSQLSEPERRVITLSVFGGYTSREIAGILKKREGSIRSIKSRALAKLREKNADL